MDINDKKGLHDAKTGEEKVELDKQIKTAKAGIDKHLEEEADDVHEACAKAKDQIKQLDGKHQADERMAHLEKAIKFCKKANSVLAEEKKEDYGQLDKVKKQAIDEMNDEVESEDKDGEDSSSDSASSDDSSSDEDSPTASAAAKDMAATLKKNEEMMDAACKKVTATAESAPKDKRQEALEYAKQQCAQLQKVLEQEKAKVAALSHGTVTEDAAPAAY